MKKYFLSLLIILSIVLTGCGSNEEETKESPTATPEKYTIALVMKTLTNPFFIEMERGARQAEEEFGIELVVRTAAQETSIEQQVQIIDDLVNEKVDAIVIAPGDSQALIPALKKAQDVGIIIINIDNRIDPEVAQNAGLVNVPFISVDNEQGGYLSAQYISQDVTEPTEAAILEGIVTAQNGQDRKNGALRAFGENENITVVASETANWKIDEAYTVIQTIFEAHPNVKLIFCANDMMALGVVQYLTEAGLTDVKVAAYDALEEAKAAVQAGTLAITIDQQAARQGYIGIEQAIKRLRGEEVPAETMVDVLPITADTQQ